MTNADQPKIDISREALNLPKTSEEFLDREIPRVRTSQQEVVKKESAIKRISFRFFGGTIGDTANYALQDVLIPAVKDLFVDLVKSGIERLVYGEMSQNRPRTRSRNTHTNYNSMYDGPSRRNIERARSRQDFSDIPIATRAEAEDILSRLNDYLTDYGVVRVSDFYDMVGVTAKYTDVNWGWTDLRGSMVRQVREGWIIEMPQAKDVRNVRR